MNELREDLQYELSLISGLDCGPPVPDSVIETGKTYLGYELQEDYQGSDQDNNYTIRVSFTGRIVRKDSFEENTLFIVDKAISDVKVVLKELNFKYSVKDITLENSVRKMLITAYVVYNELNNKFIV